MTDGNVVSFPPRRTGDMERRYQRELAAPAEGIQELDGGAVIADAEAFLAKYVILPEPARLPVALWAIATHSFDSFDVFPYLALLSPTPRCGKTRLLELLELLTAKPWRGTAPTEAALFRFIEQVQPTLLLDEVEGLARRHNSDRDSAVLAILNAGYKKGQTVPRCSGESHKLQHFRVYCPKAFASIGRLPPTLADRSIIISMQRRGPGDTVARFRLNRAKNEAAPIRSVIEATVTRFSKEIERTYADLPELGFLSDRDDEIFSPLFAVCAVLSPGRVKELQVCAERLCEGKTEDAVEDSLPFRLLCDLQAQWPPEQENWHTKSIIAALKSIDGGPWQTDCELTDRRLGRLLRPFDIRSRDVRAPDEKGEDRKAKGYIRSEVNRVVVRYSADPKATSETSPVNTG